MPGFVAAALVLLLIPGPGVLYIVARSLSQGHRAGLVSVLGLSAGALVHVAAATAGLSAILLASATAFGIVKALGAGYLIYLGVRTLAARGPAAGLAVTTPRSLRRLFTDGVLVSVLNGGRVMPGPLPRYASGVLYLGLGVGTALAGRRH